MSPFAAKIQHRYDMLAFVSRGGLSYVEMQTGFILFPVVFAPTAAPLFLNKTQIGD